MFCKQCGARMEDNARFCINCGESVADGPPRGAAAPPPHDAQPRVDRSAIPPPPPAYQQMLGPSRGAPPPPPPASYPPPAPGGTAPGGNAADIDFEGAFKSVTQIDGWVGRMFLLGLLCLVPIVQFFILGYFVELARNVARGQADFLPDIKIGEQLVSGIMYLLAMLCFGLLAGLASIVVIFFSFFVGIAVQLYLKPGLAIAVIEDSPWAVFQFSRVFNVLTKNFVPVLLLVLMDIVIGLISMAGLCACGVGVLITAPYAMSVSWHLTGQLGRLIKSQGL